MESAAEDHFCPRPLAFLAEGSGADESHSHCRNYNERTQRNDTAHLLSSYCGLLEARRVSRAPANQAALVYGGCGDEQPTLGQTARSNQRNNKRGLRSSTAVLNRRKHRSSKRRGARREHRAQRKLDIQTNEIQNQPGMQAEEAQEPAAPPPEAQI